ncbi:cytochrome P450 4d2-like [Rhynchophorus ferrugineus]|uniref:cytochrome P450 4d2-like n=1 Tax=Rhynchophorus ferrugineus TaxID=354439 RepID=UPI003FCEA9B2
MLLVFEVIFAILVVYFSIKFWRVYRIRKQLEWVPSAKRLPFIGALLEMGNDSTELIYNLTRLTANPKKSCYIEIGFDCEVLTRDHDFTEFLLSSNKLINKSWEYQMFEDWLGTGLLTAGGTKWKKRRRIITPGFHFSILNQYIESFDLNGRKLVEILKNEGTKPDGVDIYSYITNCALDIISESAMGVSVKSQEGQNQQYVVAVKDILSSILDRSFSLIKSNPYLFPFTPDYWYQKRLVKILHSFTNNVIESRLKSLQENGGVAKEVDEMGKKRKLAFLDLLLSSTVDGKPLSKEDIREEVDTFMFEGHDTTSFAISMGLYLLANNTKVQTTARNELNEIFGDDKNKETTLQDINEMKYLDLVIKEILRLYPPVPHIIRTVNEDIKFKDHIIPKGTDIALFIYGINRDPDYHDNPEACIPERHLEKNNKYHFAYIPFSAGPRNCIGQKFALLEMKSLLSKIIRNFEILPTNPVHEPQLAMNAVFKSLNGVRIRLRPI